MNQIGRTIAKNASIMMLSQLVTWGLSILLTVFLPRYLGVAAVGTYHLANSLWILLTFVAQFGMDVYLTKEVSREPDRVQELFNKSILLRALLFVAGAGLMAVYVLIAGYETQTMLVIAISGLVYFTVSLTNTCDSVLRGLERMEFISLGVVTAKTVFTVGTIILLVTGQGVIAIVVLGIFAEVLNLIIQFSALVRLQAIRIRPNLIGARQLLTASFPYLLVYVFIIAYQQVDVITLSLLVDENAVGWYGAADRLFGTLLFIPSVFMTAIFPTMSRLYATNGDSMIRLARKSFDLLFLLSVPIGLGLAIIAGPLVVLLYGTEFLNSGPVLSILGVVLLFTFLNMILGQYLISMDRQKQWTKVIAFCAFLTIPLDIVLVPLCQRTFGNGAMGGALAFLVTEPIMTVAAIWLLPKGILSRSSIRTVALNLLAGLAMAAAVWGLRDLFIAIPILVGGAVYVFCIFLFKVIPTEDYALLKETGIHLLSRFQARSLHSVSAGRKE